MAKKMITLITSKRAFVGGDHRYPGEPFTVNEDLFKDKTGKVTLPPHLKKLGEKVVSDDELKREADEKAEAEKQEKQALLKEAADLNIKGVSFRNSLDTLRAKVEEARLSLQDGNE